MTKAELNPILPSRQSPGKPLAISEGGEVVFGPEAVLTLTELLPDAAAKATGKRIIQRLPDGGDQVQSYAELLREAECIHAGLTRQGLRAGDNVVVLLEKNHDVVPVFWACMLGGFAPVILEVPSHFEASNRAFEHACELFALLDAKLVVTAADLREGVARLQAHLPAQAVAVAAVEDLRAHAPGQSRHAARPEDIAFFCLTSGSTGMPKCVPISHRNAMVRNKGTNSFNHHDDTDVYLNWLPFDHIGSLGEHIRCVEAGCDMVYLYKENILGDPLNMLHAIDRYRVTHTWGPNFIYALIRDAMQESTAGHAWDLSSIKFMISGGEPVSSVIMNDFLARAGQYGFPVTGSRPSYGMAEVCAGITYGEPSIEEPLAFFWIEHTAFDGEDVRISAPASPGAKPFANLGYPIPGVGMRIVDAQQQLLPEETVGHLQLKGDLVLDSYYRDPEFNAECFMADGWFDTGDLGFLSGGKLALTGRAKALLIINGSNYHSHEIESVVESVDGVETAFTAACAVRDADGVTDKLAIFFHALIDDAAGLRELIRHIRHVVVSRVHLNPDYIIRVDREEIPKTPIGKIQRNVLADRFNQGLFAGRLENLDSSAEHGESGPRSPLEALLAETWRDVLGVEAGIHDNFFDLGGSSIKAVMVMNKFQDKAGAIFHPVSLFDAPTIAELAQYFQDNYPALFKADAAGQADSPPLTAAQIEHMRGYLAKKLGSETVHADLSGGKNKRAVFILSPARSGSTLLRVILAGNPLLFSPPELYLLGFNRLGERRECYSERLAFLREGVIRAFMELKGQTLEQAEQLMREFEARDLSVKELFALIQAELGERMLIDKTPPYAFNPAILQRLEAEFEEPLYIHLMRHPAGMIASFEEARVDLAVDVHGDEADGIELSGRQKGELWWLVSHQNIRQFLDGIPDDRRHVVKFEDLVTTPETTVTQLCGFLGVDFYPGMLEPQQDKKQRMTDGAHELSRLAGDPKFHTHTGISSAAAESWRSVYPRDFLCAETWKIANAHGYICEHHATPLMDFQVKPDLANRFEPFPLTDIQQAYWAGRNLAFELGGYSVHSYTEVDGAGLDARRLNDAWQKMIDRHEMLRTIIRPDGRQQILDYLPKYNIRVLDLGNLDSEGAQAELAATRKQMSHQVFSAEHWPLFEICVSRLDETHCRVHLSFDAILFDARSRYIIFSEFRQFYQQPELEKTPFELSFRDYVLMEEKLKESPLFARSRDYWMEQIPALPPAPELPLAINPAALDKPRFVQKNHFFAAQDWKILKARAAERQITPSCLLLTAFSDVLRLWNKLDSFTLNLTAYNRQPLHPEVNDIIGDFTSLILLAIDGGDSLGFTARARNVQKRLWDNLSHNHFSGIQVLREIARRNDHKPGARMPVVFTSVLGDEIQETGQKTTDWLGEVAFNVAQTPQIWFDHIAFEEGGGLLCRWNVVDTLFPAGLMDAMFDAYLDSLRRLLQDAEAWDESWRDTARRLLPASQSAQRLAVNATASPVSGELLHALFARQVPLREHQPAVIAADKTLSYRELYELSNRIGHRLQAMGAKPNQLVAVAMEKGRQQVAAVMGILASGAAYLPIDPELPEERFRYLLAFGQVEVVLTETALHALLDWPAHVRCLCVDDAAALAAESAEPPPVRQQPGDLAYVIFTSGSTGLPKGVMIDHRGAVNTVLDINARFNVGANDRAIALSALSFDLSVYDIFGLLAAGGAVVMPRAADIRNPPQWIKLLNSHRVTLWNSVPAFVGLLAEYVETHPAAPVDSLRLVMMSGDWIPPSLPEKVQQLFPQTEVVSLGGATEASIWSILYPIDRVDAEWKSIPYGKPMLNQQFHVLNAALEDCPAWVPGSLYIGGIGLAQGYWRDAERTNKAFIIHPRSGERLYCTGDLGRYLPDGNIEFLGREDFQVKIQGFRVETGEIEAALMQHPHVRAAVVEARGDARAEKQLVAYVVPEPFATVTPEALREFLSRKLPVYMIPVAYALLPELPLSANGKVDRKALPEPRAAEVAHASPAVVSAPPEGIAARILGIVENVLGKSGIGYNDIIFNFGGTSIHMMRIVNQLDTELDFRPAIDDFYMAPSVAGLMAVYADMHGKPAAGEGADSAALLSAWRPEQFPFIADPGERAAFKQQQPGLRHLDAPSIALGKPAKPEDGYDKRRSCRRFLNTPIALEAFGEFLACLSQEARPDQPKYLYGSAGGLYPVQTYVYVKPGRVAGMAGGVYYHHPLKHSLERLSAEVELDAHIYNPHINRPIFVQSAFAVFLVAQMAAIAPLYRESALHFSVLEAGLMSQLMETHAPDTGIGLCQVGEVDFGRIRHLFALDDSHILVHSLLGGIPADAGHDAGREEEVF
jgi:amino acid adenylation domain-containing protein